MKPVHVLIVDDESEFRCAARRVFERRGFEVSEAADGLAALKRICSTPPDLVLLDYKMEGMDGISVLREIRKIDENLPVVVVTGHGGFDEALAGLGLKILDFINKPVDLGRLAAHIRKWIVKDHGRPLEEPSVQELMVPAQSYEQLYSDQTLREAIAKLRESLLLAEASTSDRGHRSVLVFDRSERFVGLLRISDVLRAVVPEYLREPPCSSFFTGMFLAQGKVLARQSISELVTGPPAIDVNTPLIEAVHLMAEHRVVNLAVLDEGELVGVLRDKDVLGELHKACNVRL